MKLWKKDAIFLLYTLEIIQIWYLEVKYRIHDELYPEVDEMGHHNIDEDGIAKTLLPYIKSLHEIYSRIYPTSNF